MINKENNSEILEEKPTDNAISNSDSPGAENTGSKEESDVKENETPELSELDELRLELEEKNKEIQGLKDKNLRLQAQAANDRKRFKSDADLSAFETKKRFLKKILDIRDNIDRALSAFDPNLEEHNSHREGIQMIASQFDDLFELEGIKEMNAKGEMYDLLKHEVMSRVPYNGPENRVIDVVQKGYLMNNKVLRVAKVVLSMKAPKSEEKQQEAQEKENK